MSARLGVSAPGLVGKDLTTRELQVLGRAAAGQTTTQTARALHLTADTVRKHRQTMMDKLGAANIVNAVHIAHQTGVL